MAASGRILVGCSGWNYRDWRDGVFYPPRLPAREWLPFYARQLETVELNTTFYRLPRRSAVERWVEQAPDGFMFAVKVSRFVTHIKRLHDAGTHLSLLLERIEPLVDSPQIGPLLWQLPPTFRRDDERLAATLAELPPQLRHAIEFRHESWFDDEVLQLLERHNVALVIADRPEIRSFQRHELTADFSYVRLHYGARGRRGNYSRTELAEWSARASRWAANGDVFVYFNNDWEGFAPANALALQELVRAGVSRPDDRPFSV